jgi:hypothetical protein
MIEKLTEEDLRYLRFYENLDSRRTASWLKSKPTDLSPRNRERLGMKSEELTPDAGLIKLKYLNKQDT